MNFLNRFKSISLPKIIILFFVLFSIIPMLVLSLFIYNQSVREAEARVVSQLRQTSQYVNNELNIILNEASRLMNFTSSYTISNFLTSKTPEERYQNARAVGETFDSIRQFQSSNSYILDMSVMGIDGYSISERDGFFVLDKPFDAFDQFRQVIEEPRKTHIQTAESAFNDREKNALTVSSTVFKISTNEINGILRVTIDDSFISDILLQAKPSTNGQTFIVDDTGTYLFNREESFLLNQETVTDILNSQSPSGFRKSAKYSVAFNKLPSTGWTVVSVAPNHEIYEVVNQLQVSTLIMIAISLVLIIAIHLLLSKYIARPILKLNELMQKAASGNLDVEIPTVHGQVEIMNLYESFGKLMEKIRGLHR